MVQQGRTRRCPGFVKGLVWDSTDKSTAQCSASIWKSPGRLTLSQIIDARDRLPEAVRAGIVAMVQAAAGR
jgi:hypothetical protein